MEEENKKNINKDSKEEEEEEEEDYGLQSKADSVCINFIVPLIHSL